MISLRLVVFEIQPEHQMRNGLQVSSQRNHPNPTQVPKCHHSLKSIAFQFASPKVPHTSNWYPGISEMIDTQIPMPSPWLGDYTAVQTTTVMLLGTTTPHPNLLWPSRYASRTSSEYVSSSWYLLQVPIFVRLRYWRGWVRLWYIVLFALNLGGLQKARYQSNRRFLVIFYCV